MLSTTRANQVEGIVARWWVPLSREEWEGSLLASFARATRTLGRCSLDARSGSSNRPPSREKKASKLGRIIWKDKGRSMRAIKGSLGRSPKKRHRGGSPWLHSDVKTTIMYIPSTEGQVAFAARWTRRNPIQGKVLRRSA